MPMKNSHPYQIGGCESVLDSGATELSTHGHVCIFDVMKASLNGPNASVDSPIHFNLPKVF